MGYKQVSAEHAESDSKKSRRAAKWSVWLLWTSALLAIASVSKSVWESYDRHTQNLALRCDEPVFDFGHTHGGSIIHHTFKIINIGSRPLKIEKAILECGCTSLSADLAGATMVPQGTLDIPVRLAAGPKDDGNIERRIVVRFAGGVRPDLILRIKGVVNRPWNWNPEAIVFDDIPADEVRTRVVTVIQDPDAPIAEISGISATPTLAASFERDVGDRSARRWKITINTVPPMPVGRSGGQIYINVSNLPQQTIKIPVTVFSPAK